MDRIEKLRKKKNKRAQEITAQEIIKQKTEESEVVGQEKTEQKTAAPEVKTQENTEIRFTPAQQACIDERGKDILVRINDKKYKVTEISHDANIFEYEKPYWQIHNVSLNAISLHNTYKKDVYDNLKKYKVIAIDN